MLIPRNEMVVQNIVPYGEWQSPITVGSVTSKNRALSSPRIHGTYNEIDGHGTRSLRLRVKRMAKRPIFL
ncbi:hypothetical protein F5B20DRAFT_565965 [Whalleya microplaca]|nr:hypothetical protein F5B20DRAFT_565965 [Whalleya microplaca]